MKTERIRVYPEQHKILEKVLAPMKRKDADKHLADAFKVICDQWLEGRAK